jgi:hypothetical protein
MASNSWWTIVSGSGLAQGDLLEDCLVPIFSAPAPVSDTSDSTQDAEADLASMRLLVVTQSCDLEHGKANFVALCPTHTIDEFEAGNPSYSKNWENVRTGRVAGQHLLASPIDPGNNRKCYVVDFGQIISLPADYISEHAKSLKNRWRLSSPYVEHFSQAFARFFMRVGLPSDIPSFNKK